MKKTQGAIKRMKEVAGRLQKEGNYDVPTPSGVAVHFPVNKNLKVSVSAIKMIEWDDPTTEFLEIALIGADDKLIYNENLGYDDVQVFDGVDAVLKELKRLEKETAE